MRNRKNTSKIILAIIVAILATMISFSVFNNMNKQIREQTQLIETMRSVTQRNNLNRTYAYAVATKDLKAGEIVSDEDVDFKNFNTENFSGFENRSKVVNKVLLKDITIGEQFTSNHIATISNDADTSLREGYRALTLPADNFQGKSDKMIQGALVDIYTTSGNSDWLLDDVKIISFEKKEKSASSLTSAPINIMNADSITFEVSTDNIPDLISNVSKGRLMLVVKNPNDKKITRKITAKSKDEQMGYLPNLPAEVPITNLSGLPQPISPPMEQFSVEVIEANVKSKVTFD